jgi:hypothetical protein
MPQPKRAATIRECSLSVAARNTLSHGFHFRISHTSATWQPRRRTGSNSTRRCASPPAECRIPAGERRWFGEVAMNLGRLIGFAVDRQRTASADELTLGAVPTPAALQRRVPFQPSCGIPSAELRHAVPSGHTATSSTNRRIRSGTSHSGHTGPGRRRKPGRCHRAGPRCPPARFRHAGRGKPGRCVRPGRVPAARGACAASWQGLLVLGRVATAGIGPAGPHRSRLPGPGGVDGRLCDIFPVAQHEIALPLPEGPHKA